jgi:hypothetical protein
MSDIKRAARGSNEIHQIKHDGIRVMAGCCYLITLCQREAKAIPLICRTDRAEISVADRADCDGTRFVGLPFWRMPQPVLRSVAYPSVGPSIRE